MSDQHANDHQFIRSAIRGQMEKIRRNAVVEEVIRHARIQTSRHPVHQRPLDSHDPGKDDIPNAQPDKTDEIDVPVDQIMQRSYNMPDPEQQCLDQNCGFCGVIRSEDFIKQAPECAFFHNDVNDIKENAHQNEADAPVDLCCAGQGKSHGKEAKPDGISLGLQNDDLNGVGHKEDNGGEREAQYNAPHESVTRKADVAPFPLQNPQGQPENEYAEQLVDEILSEEGFIHPQKDCFKCVDYDQETEDHAACFNRVFQK